MLCLALGLVYAQDTAMHTCPKPSVEGGLSSIVEGMLREGSMPVGDILDVGANTGEMTCLYACVSPLRVVHAIDPSHDLIQKLHCTGSNNIKKVAMTLGRSSINKKPLVDTIDHVLADRRMGFMHLDVEGSELDVLIGGNRVIARDRPLFSVEVHYRERQKLFRGVNALLNHIAALNYSAYVVHEVCGWGTDCRNVLCFPNEKLHTLAYSPIIDISIRSGILVKINTDRQYGSLHITSTSSSLL